jgi:hypothetical protein
MRVLGVVPGRRGLSVAPVLRRARRAASRSRAGRAADSAGLRYVKTGLDDWRRSERNRAFIISWIYIPGAVHDKVGLFSRYVFGASAGLLFSTPVLSACSSSVFGTRSFKQVVFLTCGVGRSFSLSLFL